MTMRTLIETQRRQIEGLERENRWLRKQNKMLRGGRMKVLPRCGISKETGGPENEATGHIGE